MLLLCRIFSTVVGHLAIGGVHGFWILLLLLLLLCAVVAHRLPVGVVGVWA